MIQKSSQSPQEKGVIESWWSGLVKKNIHVLPSPFFFFLLLLFFLPTQLGFHFWPWFSYVNGIRIDYLSPTFYFTDALLLLVVIFTLFQSRKKRHIWKRAKKLVSLLVFILMLSFFLSIVFSQHKELAIYGSFRLVEILLMATITCHFLRGKAKKQQIYLILSLTLFYVSLLAILQSIHNGYIGGFFYFLGERAITPLTPGAATVSLFGSLNLRPYAVFSHPNVLAAYLLLVSYIVLSNLKYLTNKKFTSFAFVLSSLVIVLSLSRVTILILFFLVMHALYLSWKKKGKYRFILSAIFICAALFFANVLIARFFLESVFGDSLTERWQLLVIAKEMLSESTIFGIGSLNFIPELPFYLVQTNQAYLLQPVHNFFFLYLLENGVIAFLGTLYIVLNRLYRLYKKRVRGSAYLILLFLMITILGMVDHYFLTSQQGRLLLGFCLGLLFSDENRIG